MIASTTFVRANAWPSLTRTSTQAALRRLIGGSLLACLVACALVIGAWSAPAPRGDGVASPSATSVKAAFIYRFLAFVEWPEQAFVNADAPMVIGVLGGDALAHELEEVVANRRIDERAIEVRRVDVAHALDGVNVLYVGERAASALPGLAARAARASVLVVTDFADALDQGSVINLLVVDNRVRFEVSLEAAARSALRLSSRLLGVAYRVRAH